MTEKYYVVSEGELKDLARTWSYAPGPHKLIDTTKAEAACRTRPVPEWATHFHGSDYPFHQQDIKRENF
jgi:hypothetical protein